MQRCRAAGFQGDIWPVNPHRSELAGVACWPSVDALPHPPDAAFVAVPAGETVKVVARLAARGAGGCVCYAAGFAETGPAGRALERALREAAAGMPLVGPNCYGVLNYVDGVALWPDSHGRERVERGVAVLSQSGNLGLNVGFGDRSVPLAYLISVGNQACVEVSDLIATLVGGGRVSAIGLILEGLQDVGRFAAAARLAFRHRIPLVVLKTGKSAMGARLTLSHTSTLAGSDELYDALFERLGVARVASPAALLETLKLLHVLGPLPGRRVVSLSCSGGEAALIADLGEAVGLEFPPLREDQCRALRSRLPDYVTIANPFDYNTSVWGERQAAEFCFRTAMSGEADLAVLVLDYPSPEAAASGDWSAVFNAFVDAQSATGMKCAVVSTLAELCPRPARDLALASGVAPMQGLEDALRAIDAAARCGERLRDGLDEGEFELSTGNGVSFAERSSRSLDEWSAKQALAAYGLRTPLGRFTSGEGARRAAIELGFPVVVKGCDGRLIHKTEAGAVVLGCTDAESVSRAVERIRQATEVTLGGCEHFLVERQIDGVVAELLVGIKRDPQFGLALVVASGGTLVELLRDRRVLLLPTRAAAVARALRSLRIMELMSGYRGRPPGDLEAAVDAVLSVARFAESHCDVLLELDVNPLAVLARGEGAIAVDIFVRFATGGLPSERERTG